MNRLLHASQLKKRVREYFLCLRKESVVFDRLFRQKQVPLFKMASIELDSLKLKNNKNNNQLRRFLDPTNDEVGLIICVGNYTRLSHCRQLVERFSTKYTFCVDEVDDIVTCSDEDNRKLSPSYEYLHMNALSTHRHDSY